MHIVYFKYYGLQNCYWSGFIKIPTSNHSPSSSLPPLYLPFSLMVSFLLQMSSQFCFPLFMYFPYHIFYITHLYLFLQILKIFYLFIFVNTKRRKRYHLSHFSIVKVSENQTKWTFHISQGITARKIILVFCVQIQDFFLFTMWPLMLQQMIA